MNIRGKRPLGLRLGLGFGLSCALVWGWSGSALGQTTTTRADEKFVAGKVDTLPILQSDPDYNKMSESYVREKLELRKRIGIMVRDHKMTPAEAGPAYAQQSGDLEKKWMKSTNDFIQTRHAKMRSAVEQLCREKGIDIVVIDSKAYPTVEWGAVDITRDVMTKVYGDPTGAAATPTAGGTP